MAGLGAPELLIVLVLVLLVFGGAKLPKLARSLGSARREFEEGAGLARDRAITSTRPTEPRDAA